MTRTLEVGVKVVIQNKEGKYLVLLRSKPFYGESFTRWDIPGGRIDIGEELEKALKREVFEETGLKLKRVDSILLAQDLLRNPKKHTVRITYKALCNAREVVLNPLEHSQYKWVTLSELKKLKHDLYLTPVLKLLS